MTMSDVKPIVREDMLAQLREDVLWDVVVIGGGATGTGIAVDAASRGLKVVLLEAQDFSAGTSSRSTTSSSFSRAGAREESCSEPCTRPSFVLSSLRLRSARTGLGWSSMR